MTDAGLKLTPGVGVIGRTDPAGGRLLLDASRTDAAESVCYFAPGLASAKTLGLWRNMSASRSSLITGIEENYRTAAVTMDPLNYWRDKIKDGNGHTRRRHDNGRTRPCGPAARVAAGSRRLPTTPGCRPRSGRAGVRRRTRRPRGAGCLQTPPVLRLRARMVHEDGRGTQRSRPFP